jgi:hypothetical protein
MKRIFMMDMLRIKQVVPLANRRSLLTLSDGSIRERDVTDYLTGPVFEPIRNDPSLFAQARAKHGTLDWPGGIDL